MKSRRKLSAILFALVLCFAFALPVHAAETGSSGTTASTEISETGAVSSADQSLSGETSEMNAVASADQSMNTETSETGDQPSTGDTTIFYVAGGALMVGGIVLLITRKRMNQ